MNVTVERLYQILGELYVANALLNDRVKELTPRPQEALDEHEAGIVDYIRQNGSQ